MTSKEIEKFFYFHNHYCAFILIVYGMCSINVVGLNYVTQVEEVAIDCFGCQEGLFIEVDRVIVSKPRSN